MELLRRYWAWRTHRKEVRKQREEEKKLRKGPVRYWIDVPHGKRRGFTTRDLYVRREPQS